MNRNCTVQDFKCFTFLNILLNVLYVNIADKLSYMTISRLSLLDDIYHSTSVSNSASQSPDAALCSHESRYFSESPLLTSKSRIARRRSRDSANSFSPVEEKSKQRSIW